MKLRSHWSSLRAAPCAALMVSAALAACGGPTQDTAVKTPAAPVASTSSSQAASATKEVPMDVRAKADAFLKAYNEEFAAREHKQALSYWTAANSGKKEDFDVFAQADLELKMLHSDAARYAQIQELLKSKDQLDPKTVRTLEVAELAFKGNQLPKDILEQMVKESAAIEQIFNTYRPEVGGKKLTNNDLLESLAKEKDSSKRKADWEALKEVGAQVGPKLIALAKVRNEAAKKLGYQNYWDMQVRLQEHDPATLLAVFDQLEKLTNEPFKKMKTNLDAELARRFKIKPEQMMPWHYDNPFFQSAPPSEKLNLDVFYEKKPKEDIVQMAGRFYSDIGLSIEEIAAHSDLYERKDKDQHAFCITIDRRNDVRTLLNVKPTEEWMETMLHEMGHAVYYRGINQELPYNLRESAHIFTTEAVAMLFGALAKNPTWMTSYAGADPKMVKKFEAPILEQRRREQLIFVRWGLVMLNFEKALYENPDQDLNKLWYDLVERYQGLKRPQGRNAADWAAKPHFTIAPVYYHNYVLGEVFAAQMRSHLAKMAGHKGPSSTLVFNGRKDFGQFFMDKVFRPGMTMKWPDFVQQAVGEPLSPAALGEEVK